MYAMINQLYEDAEKLAIANPGHLVESAMVSIFNAGLEDARTKVSRNAVLVAIPEATEEMRLAEFLVCVGQLKVIAQKLAEDG